MPPLTRPLLFLVAAIVCFGAALIIQLSVVNGGDVVAWMLGGLLSFALAHLP